MDPLDCPDLLDSLDLRENPEFPACPESLDRTDFPVFPVSRESPDTVSLVCPVYLDPRESLDFPEYPEVLDQWDLLVFLLLLPLLNLEYLDVTVFPVFPDSREKPDFPVSPDQLELLACLDCPDTRENLAFLDLLVYPALLDILERRASTEFPACPAFPDLRETEERPDILELLDSRESPDHQPPANPDLLDSPE